MRRMAIIRWVKRTTMTCTDCPVVHPSKVAKMGVAQLVACRPRHTRPDHLPDLALRTVATTCCSTNWFLRTCRAVMGIALRYLPSLITKAELRR